MYYFYNVLVTVGSMNYSFCGRTINGYSQPFIHCIRYRVLVSRPVWLCVRISVIQCTITLEITDN